MTTVGNSIRVAASSIDPLIYLPHFHLQRATIPSLASCTASCMLAANLNGMLVLFANAAPFFAVAA